MGILQGIYVWPPGCYRQMARRSSSWSQETWRCLYAKFVLRVTGPEATNVCHDDQLCDSLKSGVDGYVHGFQAILCGKSSTEDWGLLPVDAKNVFNKINGIEMLWTVFHLWPPGARF